MSVSLDMRLRCCLRRLPEEEPCMVYKNYIRVELPPSPDNDRLDNQLVKVKLGDFNHDKTALKALL